LGATPLTVKFWEDIPAVPQQAFKDFDLRCFPPELVFKEFHTSGTTNASDPKPGIRQCGVHFLDTLELYEVSLLEGWHRTFERGLFQGAWPLLKSPETFILLVPPVSDAPHSSLSHMMHVVSNYFAPKGSRAFWKEGQLEFQRIVDALHMACDFNDPVFIIGTAFTFVHLIDELHRRGEKIVLPEGSFILETGGYKGRSRELTKAELYSALTTTFGVPDNHLFNEYGMTELGVQFYACGAKGLHTVPPWARVQLMNPSTGKEVANGETGLVRVCDLSNRGSVLSIQTEDAAVRQGAGFQLLGRVSASSRGCSIAADDLLKMQRGQS